MIDAIGGNTDVCTRYSPAMGPIWPFRKNKPGKPSISRSSYTKNVVEYERKTGEKKTEKKENHLEGKKFKEAMSLLSRKSEDD